MKFNNKIVLALFMMFIIGSQNILALESTRKAYKHKRVKKVKTARKKAYTEYDNYTPNYYKYYRENEQELENENFGFGFLGFGSGSSRMTEKELKEKIEKETAQKFDDQRQDYKYQKWFYFFKGIITSPMGMRVQCLDELVLGFFRDIKKGTIEDKEAFDENTKFDMEFYDYKSVSYLDMIKDALNQINADIQKVDKKLYDKFIDEKINTKCIFKELYVLNGLKKEVKNGLTNLSISLGPNDEIKYRKQIFTQCKKVNNFYAYEVLEENEKVVENLKLKIKEIEALMDEYRVILNSIKKDILNASKSIQDLKYKDLPKLKKSLSSLVDRLRFSNKFKATNAFLKEREQKYSDRKTELINLINTKNNELTKLQNNPKTKNDVLQKKIDSHMKDVTDKVIYKFNKQIKRFVDEMIKQKNEIKKLQKNIDSKLEKTKKNEDNFNKVLEALQGKELDDFISKNGSLEQKKDIQNKLAEQKKKSRSGIILKIQDFFKKLVEKVKNFLKKAWNAIKEYIDCKLTYKKYELAFSIAESVVITIFPGFYFLKVLFRFVRSIWNWLDIVRQFKDAKMETEINKKYEGYGTVTGLTIGMFLYILFGIDLLPPQGTFKKEKKVRKIRKQKRFRMMKLN